MHSAPTRPPRPTSLDWTLYQPVSVNPRTGLPEIHDELQPLGAVVSHPEPSRAERCGIREPDGRISLKANGNAGRRLEDRFRVGKYYLLWSCSPLEGGTAQLFRVADASGWQYGREQPVNENHSGWKVELCPVDVLPH